MQGFLYAACGTLFLFAMTSLGAATVFFFRRAIGLAAQRLCFGFAAGVMVAASMFSLLNPAREQLIASGQAAWLVMTAGFSLGCAFLFVLNFQIERLQRGGDDRRRTLLFTAVTLHNIPEGMAVGLAFAIAAREGGLAPACALALGIGIQNLPEGAAISLPMRQSGMSRLGSFGMGVLSGIVEPIFGVLVVFAAEIAQSAMPLLMAFAAGSMLAVSVSEMIPEAAEDRRGALAAMMGFLLMMALDVGLG